MRTGFLLYVEMLKRFVKYCKIKLFIILDFAQDPFWICFFNGVGEETNESQKNGSG